MALVKRTVAVWLDVGRAMISFLEGCRSNHLLVVLFAREVVDFCTCGNYNIFGADLRS